LLWEAYPGRNILLRGSDVKAGQTIVSKNQILTPALTGLLAAGGVDKVTVFPNPRVGIVATGDEVVMPGTPLKPGQLYASNLITLLSWLRNFNISGEAAVVRDDSVEIRDSFTSILSKVDVLLTSGGAWKSERDLTINILEDMGWDLIYHRVRIGPGKGIALGFYDGKSVFCLPGGPPSNEMAFLQIALPGLLQIASRSPVPFKIKKVRLAQTVTGEITWTQFFRATLEKRGNRLWAVPQKLRNRLRAQAQAEAIIKIPEGAGELKANDKIEVQVLF
jgi:molybdopterin molybdotransferase